MRAAKFIRRLCCTALVFALVSIPGMGNAVVARAEAFPEPVQLATGMDGSACLYSDGTVTFDGFDVPEAESWGELTQIAISANGSFYALSHDGRLHTDNAEMQKQIHEWENLVNFSVFSDRLDSFLNEHPICELVAAVDKNGKVMIAVSADYTSDGQMPKLDVSGWSGIQSVAVGAAHVVGLKSDGTVAFTGWNENGQGDVRKWKQVTALRAGTYCTVGICADGTVKVAGTSPDRDNWQQQARQWQIDQWHDIADVAISYGNIYGLCTDGSVLGFDWDNNGPHFGGACTIRENWKQVQMIAGGYSGLVGLRSDGIIIVAGGNQLYTPAPCRMAVGEVWPHWDVEVGNKRSCFFCEREYIFPREDPDSCQHFWLEYNFGDINNRFYDEICDFICAKCGQIRSPLYTNLTGVQKLRDSNGNGSNKDVAFGIWPTRSGDDWENTICFWVMRRSGYDDTEWVEIDLNGEYETLEFCTDLRDGSGEKVNMSYKIYGDGRALKYVDSVDNFADGIVSVKDVKVLKISCTNSDSAEGWGLFCGRLYRPFD